MAGQRAPQREAARAGTARGYAAAFAGLCTAERYRFSITHAHAHAHAHTRTHAPGPRHSRTLVGRSAHQHGARIGVLHHELGDVTRRKHVLGPRRRPRVLPHAPRFARSIRNTHTPTHPHARTHARARARTRTHARARAHTHTTPTHTLADPPSRPIAAAASCCAPRWRAAPSTAPACRRGVAGCAPRERRLCRACRCCKARPMPPPKQRRPQRPRTQAPAPCRPAAGERGPGSFSCTRVRHMRSARRRGHTARQTLAGT
jgi:hypothetical protein